MGGTGALPFMDLFAYLVRKLLSEVDPMYSIFPDEKFTEIHPNAKWVVSTNCLTLIFKLVKL